MKKLLKYGAIVFVVLAVLGAIFGKQKEEQVESAASDAGLSVAGVKMASIVYSDDLMTALTGGKATSNLEHAMEVSEIGHKVTSAQYSKDFNDNEIAADKKYAGKKVLITGKIDSINKDIVGSGYLSLKTGGQLDFGMHARLSLVGYEDAAALKKGETVYVVCDPDTKIGPISVAKNCTMLEAYLNNGGRLARYVNAVLTGKKAPENVLEAISFAYVLGEMLPDDSSCYSVKANRDKCNKEIEALVKTKTDDFKQRFHLVYDRLKQ